MNNIFEILQAYKAAIFRRWWLWVLLMGVFTGIATAISLSKPTLYIVRTTFLPETQTGVSNPLSALIAGVDPGVAGAGNEMMKGVIVSSRIRRAIASDTVMAEKKVKRMTTFFLDIYPRPKDIFAQIGLIKQKPIKDTVDYIAGVLKGAIEAESDDYGYLEVKVTLPDSRLTHTVAQSLVRQVGAYYRAQKTEKARYSLAYFEQKIDSVREQLDAATYANANYVDRFKFSPYASAFIPREQATKKAEYLQGIYGQLLVSKEQAIAQLLDETPMIQVLDEPELDEVLEGNIFISLLISIIVACFFAALINVWGKARSDISAYLASLMSQGATE